MDKEFKTYNKQMQYLRNSKKIKCKGSTDKEILVRNGYYNLINGFKEPFILNKSLDGRNNYLHNVTLKEFKYLKDFDEELRFLMLKYINSVEQEVRTLFAHKFEVVNANKYMWHNADAYSKKIDTKTIINTITNIYNELKNSKKPYVTHYIEKHHVIPIWVLIKAINFATVIEMIMNSNREVKVALCELYGIEYDNYNLGKDFKILEGSLNFFRIVKNSCIHNERIFDIKRNNNRIYTKFHQGMSNVYMKERHQFIFDLIIYMKYYLPYNEYSQYIKLIKELLNNLNQKINDHAYNRVRAMMGIRQIEHLDILVKEKKEINYRLF